MVFEYVPYAHLNLGVAVDCVRIKPEPNPNSDPDTHK